MRRADFSALFKKTFGIPPKQFICSQKIETTKRLLLRTKKNTKEIAALGPELMKLESTAVYQTKPLPIGSQAFPDNSPGMISQGDFIMGIFKGKDTPNAFMVVNRDYTKKATAELTLNCGKGELLEFSRTNGKWEKLQIVEAGTKISVPLNPGDGKLFKIIK